MTELLAALEASQWATYIRETPLVYPAFNVLHVLAVMIFYAGIAGIDLAMLVSPEPPAAAVRRLQPFILATFAAILVTGFALFSPEATSTIRNPAFQFKLLAIAIGGANALLSGWALARPRERGLVRATAAASLFLWLCVAGAGRMIAYL